MNKTIFIFSWSEKLQATIMYHPLMDGKINFENYIIISENESSITYQSKTNKNFMDKILKITNFIKVIRDSFIGSEIVYTMGSCYQFYLILKEVFPEAEAYIYHNHIITKIDDKFYDITGEITGENSEYKLEFYFPFKNNDSYSEKEAEKWKFNIKKDEITKRNNSQS